MGTICTWQRLLLAAGLLAAPSARADQGALVLDTQIHGPVLTFDWPAVEIGVGSYEAGPTGVTIFRFPNKVSAAVDVRGGAPGTVNTDLLRLSYADRLLDAIVFAGGAGYGEEAITAVMTGLKDDGVRNGDWRNLGLAAGAVIYDFANHRLNEIYPDKRLAQAALHDVRPGVFPLGAQGAGRMAMQGGFFGCAAHSGQGGAFRQVGATKIATFVVLNAAGAVTDRDGNLVSCHRSPAWGDLTRTADLLERAELSMAPPGAGGTRNTTLSLVITNRRMAPGDLQRLAVQVHTSMARAIQPFSTFEDGDTLFAVSTQEVGDPGMRPTGVEIDFLAAETMWDAILASVPEEAATPPEPEVAISPDVLARLVGRYRMAANAVVEIGLQDGSLTERLVGPPFFDLRPQPTPLHAVSATMYRVDSRYGTHFAFNAGSDGRAAELVVNPGRWEQRGERIPD
jgi:L-aminopeptidase/D-esterase-like protein